MAHSTTPLPLHEEVLLLALRDEKGTIVSGTHYRFAIGGALLAELLLQNRVAIEHEGKKKKFLRVIDRKPIGEPILDECLRKVVEAKKRGQLRNWVSRFANLKKLNHRVAAQLCRKGILRADEDKVLWIFTRKIYPEIDSRPEREILKRLESAVFTETRNVSPRTIALLALANASRILHANFEKKRLKERKKRIEQVVNGDATGKATKEAIEAMQAAVAAAVAASAAVSAATAAST